MPGVDLRHPGRGVVVVAAGQGPDPIFPDLVAAAADQVPAWFVLDGEAVVWSGGRLDFEALQARMTTSKAKLPVLVREVPASFAGF